MTVWVRTGWAFGIVPVSGIIGPRMPPCPAQTVEMTSTPTMDAAMP